jgi:prevent-host-death family protein
MDGCDYIGHMIATLRETKSKLSRLVARAAQGEDVIITVHGRPTARLTPMPHSGAADRAAWLTELRALHRRCGAAKTPADSTSLISALREERV